MIEDVDMYERAYRHVEKILADALGITLSVGTGEGVAADVALLAQRYTDLRAEVLAIPGSGWFDTVLAIEDAELRDGDR